MVPVRIGLIVVLLLLLTCFATTTSSLAIAERPHCGMDQLWPKVKDDILQTISANLQPL